MHWLLRSGATAGPLQLSQNRKKETRFSSKSTISQAPPAPHPIPPDPYSTTPHHQPTYLQNPNQHPSVPNQPDPPTEMEADHRPTQDQTTANPITNSSYSPQVDHQSRHSTQVTHHLTTAPPQESTSSSYKNQTNHPPWQCSPLGQHPPPATHPSPTIKPGDAHHAATTPLGTTPPTASST